MPLLIPEILGEICSHIDQSTLALCALVCSDLNIVAERYLYSHITVFENRAPVLFKTLCKKQYLGRYVRFLHIIAKENAQVLLGGDDFEGAVFQMRNLHTLLLDSPTLKVFSSLSPVVDYMVEFLRRQEGITVLTLGDLNNHAIDICDGEFLPALKDVTAPPQDIAVLATTRPVVSVKFYYTEADYELRPTIPFTFITQSTAHITRLDMQACQLLVAPPRDLDHLLPHVQYLVLRQDRTWGSQRYPDGDFKYTLQQLVDCISFIPRLRQLVMVTSFAAKHAHSARRTLRRECSNDLQGFAFHSKTHCIAWSDVLRRKKKLVVLPLTDCLTHI
ncbi:hypothetical protein C8R43DRAFT_964422 [Mycena crocata]|nr:hypothetical protein C8R43DRAFT_964422 [Mycena crocata]